MVDSITAEQHRIEASLPLIKKHNAMVTAIMHDESGMPSDVEDRMRVMPKVDAAVREYGIPAEDVYLDCMVFPLSVNGDNGRIYLDALRRVKAEYPQYKTICGLNNVSYGLPQEDILNISFLAMCAALGQEATYIEITKESGAFIRGISALTGQDEFCMNYIDSFRESRLDIFGGE
jgi:5-methyltetrahydrofolate--homocysteine methyltransferase